MSASPRPRDALVSGPATTRPVRIDAEGRIVLDDGEQVVIPGLEPDRVSQGLAEAEAGLGRPLREILAGRRG